MRFLIVLVVGLVFFPLSDMSKATTLLPNILIGTVSEVTCYDFNGEKLYQTMVVGEVKKVKGGWYFRTLEKGNKITVHLDCYKRQITKR
ncbi:hypothetical protein [Bdellovibrio sp. BCCA]|uniref:hypothetical protein n=1 Tax=Bdellovibrio sp. BCCA TaxID=3136281 RepID=UPI0030F23DCE